jgi:hypothetical protein
MTLILSLCERVNRLVSRVRSWEWRRIERRDERCWYNTRGEPWLMEPGTYTNRGGRTVSVQPNVDGWLDGQPWLVCQAETLSFESSKYTVDSWGRCFGYSPSRYDILEIFEKDQSK